MKLLCFALAAFLTPVASWAASRGGFADIASLAGHYEGNTNPRTADGMPCTLDVSRTLLRGINVVVGIQGGVRVIDKYAPGGERIAPSAEQFIPALLHGEIAGQPDDVSAWQRRTFVNLAHEVKIARFVRRPSGSLSFAQLDYQYAEFGFFKGAEVYYNAGCYDLRGPM